MTEAAPDRKQRVSGSEKRRRTAWLPRARCTEEVRAAVELAASRSGLSLSSYVLAAAANVRPSRGSRPAPSVDQKALAQILAQLGRLNGNVNQIAKRINRGGFAEVEELRAAAAEIIGLRDQIRSALHGSRRDH